MLVIKLAAKTELKLFGFAAKWDILPLALLRALVVTGRCPGKGTSTALLHGLGACFAHQSLPRKCGKHA